MREVSAWEPVLIAATLLITFVGATHIAVGLLGRKVPFPALQAALSPAHQRKGKLRLLGLAVGVLVGAASQAAIIKGLSDASPGGATWAIYAVEGVLAVGWCLFLGRRAR